MVDTVVSQVTKIHQEIIMAGFGGQGVLKMGQILAEAAMLEGREVVWTPAYGPEMRGGPAFCTVIISSEPIGSPVVARPDAVIIMDAPSLEKYQGQVSDTGILLINSTLVDPARVKPGIACYPIPVNAMAEEIGDTRIANMIMLGALLRLTALAAPATILHALAEALPERHHHLLPLNERALEAGARVAEALKG